MQILCIDRGRVSSVPQLGIALFFLLSCVCPHRVWAQTQNPFDAPPGAGASPEGRQSERAKQGLPKPGSADFKTQTTPRPKYQRVLSEHEKRRIPVQANFAKSELVVTGLATGIVAILTPFGPGLFPNPGERFQEPARDSWEWDAVQWNPQPSPDDRWLGGVPDFLGNSVGPATLGLFYITGILGNAASASFPLGDYRHEAVAYLESFAWSMLTFNLLRLTLARPRPWVVRDDTEGSDFSALGEGPLRSFPSGHVTAATVAATFFYLDLSDYLFYEALAESSSFVRWGVGRVLPFAGLASLVGLVGASRIYEQQHWPSDVFFGAGLGVVFSTAFYYFHFDKYGNPEQRYTTGPFALQPTVLPPQSETGSWKAGLHFAF